MVDIHGLNELSSEVLEKGRCAACGACVGRCPYLVQFRGKTVKLDSCTIEGGRCYAYCPMTFFDEKEVAAHVFDGVYDPSELGRYLEVLAARSAIEKILHSAQGGGTVSSLVVAAMEAGAIDAAVLTDRAGPDGLPRGVVVTTPAEATACAGSRFVGSHSLSALRSALESGHEKIGVVGTPCQVRAVRKMALYDLKDENLRERIALVIGLFCNWAFSAREFTQALAERIPGKDVKRFDIPPPPANKLDLATADGIESIPLDEVRHLIQNACTTCPDMTSEFADVSVGMFEGRPGWNTLIVRTTVGRTLLRSAAASGRIVTEPFPQPNLDHLKQASARKRQRASTGGS